LFERLVDRLKVVAARTPRELGSDLLVKDRQSDRVLLAETQVSHASSDRRSVIELVERSTTIGHASRGVDEQGATQVGVFLVLLDDQLVLPAPDLPVDVAKVVARDVLTVLDKLDGLTKVRTAMHAREKPLDHISCPQFHRTDAPDCFRMQIVFGIGHLAAIGLEQSACFESVGR